MGLRGDDGPALMLLEAEGASVRPVGNKGGSLDRKLPVRITIRRLQKNKA
jgi:hypothetical protein